MPKTAPPNAYPRGLHAVTVDGPYENRERSSDPENSRW